MDLVSWLFLSPLVERFNALDVLEILLGGVQGSGCGEACCF